MSELYEKSLLKLELDQVLELLSQCAGSIGGKEASHSHFLPITIVPRAPKRVATDPKRISGGNAPKAKLEIKHPMNNPGTAAGVREGSTVSASDNRN